jgi:uncharacterized protein involved in type VI secretion and phage assembly
MPVEVVAHQLVIKVNGSPLPEDVEALLADAFVDDSSTVANLFFLRFSDPEAIVVKKGGFSIGCAIDILVQGSGPGGPQELISGEVTALEVEVSAEGMQTVVRGLDISHRLHRGRRIVAYLNQKSGDIVRVVAQRAAVPVGAIDDVGPVLEHVAQENVSDWEFLCRLAAEVGAVVSVSDGKLTFTTPTPSTEAPGASASARNEPLVLERGVNLVSLRATVTSAGQVSEVEVRGWDIQQKRALVAVTPARTRSADLGSVTPASLARLVGSPRHTVPATYLGTQAQCAMAATSLAEQLAGGFAELEGVARGNVALKAGAAVALTGVGEPFSGRYTVSATRHEFTADAGYLTSFTVSNRSERSFFGVAAGTSGSSSVNGIEGIMPAIVTDIKDPEERGRVRVSFPGLSDDYVSGWARTLQLGAGNGHGLDVLPEVNDEVLVAFGQGSFQEPFVLGGLYNGKDLPGTPWSDHVQSTDGRVKRRSLTSRTGMVIEMLESPDGERINVSTNAGKQRVSLLQRTDAGIEIVSEGPVTVTAKKEASVTALNDVTVTSTSGNLAMEATKVSIKARADLELSGVNVKVNGSAAAEVAGGNVKVAGSAMAELSGGVATAVRGGMVRIN